MKLRAISVITALVLALGQSSLWAIDSPRLVIVAYASSDLPRLTPEDVRRIYLGQPPPNIGNSVRPLRNVSDSLAQEVFLQKALFMSVQQYENQLLSRVFRRGGARPQVFKNFDALLDALRRDPNAVTYMWDEQAVATPGLKVLGVLWQPQQ